MRVRFTLCIKPNAKGNKLDSARDISFQNKSRDYLLPIDQNAENLQNGACYFVK